MYKKEFLLLKGDYNLLFNALFLPITFILMEIWIFRNYPFLQTPGILMIAMGIAVLYFSMFGPTNAVGSEGKTIALLETLPVEPSTWLRQKTVFWASLATLFFLPAAIGVTTCLGFSHTQRLLVTSWTIGFLIIAIWLAVSVSAIFARYDARVLQQSSSIFGKLLVAFSLVFLFPVRQPDVESGAFLGITLVIGIFLRQLASLSLKTRCDPETASSSRLPWVICALYLAATAMGIYSLYQVF